MKKNLIIGVVILLAGYFLGQSGAIKFGGLSQPLFHYGATDSSFTSPATATTTNPVLSLNANRNGAIICNNSVVPMFIFQKAIATTTGIAVNNGIPLSPIGLSTSTANICVTLEGAKGYIYAISSVAASGTVSSW